MHQESHKFSFDAARPWRVYSLHGRCSDWTLTRHGLGAVEPSTSLLELRSKQSPRGVRYWLDLSRCFDLTDGEHYRTHLGHQFRFDATRHHWEKRNQSSSTCDSATRQVTLEMGTQEALQMLEALVSDPLHIYSNVSRLFFGSEDVEHHVRAILRTLPQIDPRCGGEWCEAGGSTIAYVYPFDSSYQVYLCEPFWSLPTQGSELDSLPGVLIHEASHFYQGAGTLDVAYGDEECLTLAASHPCRATRNADSFEYLAETMWSHIFWNEVDVEEPHSAAGDTDCLVDLHQWYPCVEDIAWQDSPGCVETWMRSPEVCTDWEMSNCCICNSIPYAESGESSTPPDESPWASGGEAPPSIAIFSVLCVLLFSGAF